MYVWAQEEFSYAPRSKYLREVMLLSRDSVPLVHSVFGFSSEYFHYLKCDLCLCEFQIVVFWLMTDYIITGFTPIIMEL